MKTRIVVFGAAGFIGQHLLREVDRDAVSPVILSINARTPAEYDDRKWLVADLRVPHSVHAILAPGDTVINLAYSEAATSEENMAMVHHLVEACRRTKVARLVHCSTAVVVGNNPSSLITEETECFPVTPYEKTKHQIEKLLMDGTSDDFKVYILRPTAVLGAGGHNLRKLLHDIEAGNRIIHYMRSSLFGKRALNLVAVKDVVGALLHLSTPSSHPSGVYICSADDDPDNRYDRVECIMRKLLRKQRGIRPIPIPEQLLTLTLRLSRSGSGQFANRYYSTAKLLCIGYQRRESVAQAVREYVQSEFEASAIGRS
jgi:nucleoside-diphosphate-sugar epimerase